MKKMPIDMIKGVIKTTPSEIRYADRSIRLAVPQSTILPIRVPYKRLSILGLAAAARLSKILLTKDMKN